MARYASKERRDIHAEITGKIVAELGRGTIPWLKPWKTNGTGYLGMPRNAISRRKYSGINVVMLWMAAQESGYASNEWLTFKQAKEQGGHVRAGEKGTTVIFMKPISFAAQDAAGGTEPLDRLQRGDDAEERRLIARAYTVFNVEQCDDLDLKRAPAPTFEPAATKDGLNQAFEDAVRRTGIEVRHGGSQAFYKRSEDFVQMPPLETFLDCATYQATKAHELIHATGHKRRLDRLPDKSEGKRGYAFEELVAELGAAFTCCEFGITGDLRHASYIQSWIDLLTDDKRAIMRAASKASKAIAYLYPESAEDIDNEETREAA
jgi:antirestriction protein ArdC